MFVALYEVGIFPPLHLSRQKPFSSDELQSMLAMKPPHSFKKVNPSHLTLHETEYLVYLCLNGFCLCCCGTLGVLKG